MVREGYSHEDFSDIGIGDGIGNGESGKVYYIYLYQTPNHVREGQYRGWLHKDIDVIISSDGAGEDDWDGYYRSFKEAEDRLKKYLNKSEIIVGGE